jgi:hypothetical protein
MRDASGRNPDPSALWFGVGCDRSTGVKSEIPVKTHLIIIVGVGRAAQDALLLPG